MWRTNKAAAVLLGFGFVFAPAFAKGYGPASSRRSLRTCSFAQASPKRQNPSLPNDYNFFSNALRRLLLMNEGWTGIWKHLKVGASAKAIYGIRKNRMRMRAELCL
jgi:hypothetical protein